jgi:patatin-related protein
MRARQWSMNERFDMAFSREVRLGIVMYGGVSLAVYENGVAQELFRAVKGEGIYKLIKQLTDSDIIVDIMSGTSAGGINGIMLGHALANERDFTASANLWRNDGDLLKLLRKPSDPDTLSILDSKGFYQPRLEAAYDQMPPYPAEKKTNAIPSAVEELDVFVTGTDVHGRIFTEFDDDGHPIDVKDHRQVFLLSYREGRKNEFDTTKPGTIKGLAKLSRITSCFPVAFEPVRLPDQKDNKDADELLKRWGSLPAEHEAYFLDGGLLDNKPFSYTIDQIVHRTATRPVHRMLFYVEPDPEKFCDSIPHEAPDVMASALDALVNIPGYQSIATDLQNIAEHNDRAKTFREILRAADPSIDGEFTASVKDISNLSGDTPVLTQGAGNAGLNLILSEGRKAQYMQCRTIQIMRRGLEGILKKNGQKLHLEKPEERHAAKVLVESFNLLLREDATPGTGEAPSAVAAKKHAAFRETAGETLLLFDIYFRQRRLFYLIDAAQKLSQAPAPPKGAPLLPDDGWRGLLGWMNHLLKLLEIVQYAIESVADRAPIVWEDLQKSDANAKAAEQKWHSLQNVLSDMLDSKSLPLPQPIEQLPQGQEAVEKMMAKLKEKRQEFMEKARTRIDEVCKSAGQEASGNARLLRELDQQEWTMLMKFPANIAEELLKTYCKFPIVDSYRFPLEYMSGMETSQTIHTVRISPIDAQRAFSDRTLDDKICGNELAHFGGFLKSSWRANDIMWGRLDGACQLIECLLTPDRVIKAEKDIDPDGLELCQSFPHANVAELAQLRRMIGGLRETALKAKRQPDTFAPLWEILARISQREIIEEEVPRVIDCGIVQQREWNQYIHLKSKGSSPMSRDATVWETGSGEMDQAVIAFAANRLSAEAVPTGGWASTFADYHVGEENLDQGVPKPIVLELGSQAALRLRESLVSLTGKREKTIRSSLIYKFLAKWPIDVAYGFANTQRIWPDGLRQLMAGVLMASVAVLVMDYLFRKAFRFEEIAGWLKIAVIAIPLVGLIAVLAAFIKLAPGNKKPRFFLRRIFINPVSQQSNWIGRCQDISLKDGNDALKEILSALEKATLRPDRTQFWKVDVSQLLSGTKEIRVWSTADEHEFKAIIQSLSINVKLRGKPSGEWKLGASEQPTSRPQTVPVSDKEAT